MEECGKIFYDARDQYMKKHRVGMTDTWTRMHKSHQYHDDEIKYLRTCLHMMEQAVLEGYGWSELDLDKPKEVLNVLCDLNRSRAKEEVDCVIKDTRKKVSKLQENEIALKSILSITKKEDYREVITVENVLRNVQRSLTFCQQKASMLPQSNFVLERANQKDIHRVHDEVCAKYERSHRACLQLVTLLRTSTLDLNCAFQILGK